MTLPRTVADVLSEHVVFEVECIDRMYLNVYVPQLQYPAGLALYVHHQLGLPIASTAPLASVSDAFVRAIHRFARDHGVAVVDFARGQRKDTVMHEYLAGFTGEEGVLFIGRAQEKNTVFRTEKRRNPTTGASYPWIVRSTGVINQFYFYCVDADFGPFFLKFSTYFPYTAKLCINGNEWAKRQAAQAGIGFTALDNGFAAVADHGFSNRDLRTLTAPLLGKHPDQFTAGQMTYDLRRLREHGLITRVPHTHRYQVTHTGLHHALFLTRAHDRLLRTGLAHLTDPQPGPLHTASRNYQTAIDNLARQSGLAT